MNDPLCSLDLVGLVLRSLGRYDVADQSTGAVRSPSLVATAYDPVLGQVFVRLAFADEIMPGDVDRWAREDAPEGSLVILLRDEQDGGLGESLRERASEADRRVVVRPWRDFFAEMLRLTRIEERYERIAEEYRETEGPSFRYVDQRAVVDEARMARLLDWSLQRGGGAGGVTYVVAGYGEGKSSFCLNYAFRTIERVRDGGAIPLLFNLNEFEAGNLKAFIEKRLRDDFGLDLSFAAFRDLCRRGVFVPVLDAFDQMHSGEGGRSRIERDHGALMELRSGVSPLYVTCRRDFFEQRLRPLLEESDPDDAFSVIALQGFDRDDVRVALGEEAHAHELVALLSHPANEEILAGVQLKPLMLHVIMGHPTLFSTLVRTHREIADAGGELRPVTEYEVFSLLYDTWLTNTRVAGLPDQRAAEHLLRSVAARAQLEGMNQPLAVTSLGRMAGLGDLVATPESTEAVLEDLRGLPLLNRAMLQRDEPTIAFRFNAYLEFLTARFVIDELTPRSTSPLEFVKQNPLTWETRQMIVPNLRADIHGARMREIAKRSRHTGFFDSRFGAGNAVTLMLDCARHPRVPAAERASWSEHVAALELRGTQLQRLDARNADLVGVNFADADLRDADFSFAVLRNANLSGTSLEGSMFAEAGAVLTALFLQHSDESADHWCLIGGTDTGFLVVWEPSSVPIRSRIHRTPIKALGATGEDSTVLSVSLDGLLAGSDPSNPHAPRSFPLGLGGLRAVVATAAGDVIVGGNRRALAVLDPNGRERHLLKLPQARGAVVTALAFDGTSDRLYAGDSDGDIYAFADWREPAIGMLWRASPGGAIRSLSVMNDGSLLVAVDAVGALTLRSADAAPEVLGSGRPALSVSYAAAEDIVVWHDGRSVWRQSREPGARPARVGVLPHDMGEAVVSCSARASHIAAAGNRLVLWHEGQMGVEVVCDEPMLMDCSGMVLAGCTGLTSAQSEFIHERGGTF